ncbi:MAG: N-6 DNA methylase [Microscillaceae bacterium]|nr:N-6 DNA methylase [Microscillaceae bacterium]
MNLQIKDFTQNNFFNRQFLEDDLPKLFQDAEPAPVFEKIKQLYQKDKFAILSEAQLEEEFIKPVLQALGFSLAYQVSKKAFGKTHKPDFTLFENENHKDEHYTSDKADNALILALCESKAYTIALDNKKLDTQNPHFQLIRYLNDLKIDFGFLTNGRFWRFYETKENRAEKVFYEVDLEQIIEANDLRAFCYFYYIFRKENYLIAPPNVPITQRVDIQRLLEINREAKRALEKDLKKIIYGEESILEMIGQPLFARYKAPEYSLQDIYRNAVTFAFRLLFIAYFEDKFYEILFEKHPFYKKFSLHYFLQYLQDEDEYPPERYNGWGKLKDIFKMMNEGREDDEIPLLDGGLFAEKEAPLLTKGKVLKNRELKIILELLLDYSRSAEQSLFKRDFKSLSIRHIGNIYEGLLEFEFREALGENIYYVVYQEKNKSYEGFFDTYDYHQLKSNPKITLESEKIYPKGHIYFTNASNSRKVTASYYTPDELTHFMVDEAIEQALQAEPNILKLRILDNACGSGHFLLEVLNQITQRAYAQLDHHADLRQTLQTEKEQIRQTLSGYLQDIEIDELVLLKRLLLKRVIFGVDLNPFAVELTKLSLWLDTFILGTPLSFIQHHIKQGNALINSRLSEFVQNIQESIFKTQINDQLHALREKLYTLSQLKDTSREEIQKSKEIYEALQPDLFLLNQILNLETYRYFIDFEYEEEDKIIKAKPLDKEGTAEKTNKQQYTESLNKVFQSFNLQNFREKNSEIFAEAQRLADKYHFFHYEVAFAEVFSNGERGFHCIIGNPPWDKTKFDEKDFFPLYRSSYRTMKQSEKKDVRDNILAYPQAKVYYEDLKDRIVNSNEYFKKRFELSAGAGDGNLFRFFIENNLRLLHPQGCLTYLTPSAWSYEDGSQTLRKHILQHYHLHFFYQFENREKIFKKVDSRYKFALFQLKAKAKEEATLDIPTRFMQTDVGVLKTQEQIMPYSLEDIQMLSPEHWALMELKHPTDLTILRKAYQAFQPIDPEYMDFRNELHLTADRDLFKEEKDDLPLYEGKMIHQFDSLLAPPQYYVNEQALEQRLKSVETNRLIDQVYEQIPLEKKNGKGKQKSVLIYLGMSSEDELKPYLIFDKSFPRLVFRDVARNTDERSLISALIPAGVTYGNTLYGSMPKKYILDGKAVKAKPQALNRVLFINAIFNSLVVDYILRFIIDIHVNKTYLMRLPMPQPSDEALEANPDYRTLYQNALRLNLAHNPQGFPELSTLAEQYGLQIPTAEKQLNLLRIENDCIVARLYGISPEELKHLSSAAYFKVLHEKNPAYIDTLLAYYTS